jgi:hypothetical protein
MLSALLALAAVHQTYAHNALPVSLIFPTASARNPFRLAPGLRESRAHLDYVERGSLGKNRVGKTRSVDRSGGERCGMSPEEFAKFYPLLIDWIRNTLTASAPVAHSVASRGFPRLPLYFTQKTLASAKVVLVHPLPIPPLSSMELARFTDFERGSFDGITYLDTFFLKPTQSNNEKTALSRACSRHSMATARTRSLSIFICEWFGMFWLSAESTGSHGVRC